MELSLTGLRVLCAVAERGSFTAAASALGYTQSAISRQVAALERESGAELFQRRVSGARLTPEGSVLLRHARVILDEIDCAAAELDASRYVEHVSAGVFVSAGALILPAMLRWLRERRPDVRLTTRDGASPVLVRAVRGGTLDVALIASRATQHTPHDGLAPLVTESIGESVLMVAASTTGRFAGRSQVSTAELAGVDWIASPSSPGEPTMGVWPGLPGRPRVTHVARDWLTKLQLVAADCGVTTVPPAMAEVLPSGVQLMQVDAPEARRRLLLVRRAGPPTEAVTAVIEAIRAAFPR
ncbi:LysR family transcriptional regulator [Mycolicibacterium sp. CBM1]